MGILDDFRVIWVIWVRSGRVSVSGDVFFVLSPISGFPNARCVVFRQLREIDSTFDIPHSRIFASKFWNLELDITSLPGPGIGVLVEGILSSSPCCIASRYHGQCQPSPGVVLLGASCGYQRNAVIVHQHKYIVVLLLRALFFCTLMEK